MLRGVELGVRRGERLLLLGANGAGKSTLLRLLLGNEQPRSGRAEIVARNAVTQYFEQDQANALPLDKAVLRSIAAFEMPSTFVDAGDPRIGQPRVFPKVEQLEQAQALLRRQQGSVAEGEQALQRMRTVELPSLRDELRRAERMLKENGEKTVLRVFMYIIAHPRGHGRNNLYRYSQSMQIKVVYHTDLDPIVHNEI